MSEGYRSAKMAVQNLTRRDRSSHHIHAIREYRFNPCSRAKKRDGMKTFRKRQGACHRLYVEGAVSAKETQRISASDAREVWNDL